MGVKISELTAVSSFGGTETLVCVQTTTKRGTAAQLGAYVIDTLVAASTATPTSGDNLLAERSGDEKRLSLNSVAAYAVESAWSSTDGGAVVTGDKVLARRGSATKTLTVDALKTFCGSGQQATVLDISGLSSATLADADQYLVVQGTTAKKTTWVDVAGRAHSQFSTYLAGLSAVSAVGASDKLYITQSGVAKYVTPSALSSYVQSSVSSGIVTAMFDGDAVTPLLSTDVVAVERSGVLKSSTASGVASYVASTLAAATAITPVAAGDVLCAFRSGVAKTADIDVVSSYVGTKVLSVASGTPLTSFTTGDLLLMGRSGAVRTIGYADMISQVLSGVQASVLDIDGLSAATLASGNYLYVMDGTPKQQTLGNVAAFVHGGVATFLTAQADAAPVVASDLLFLSRSSVAKKIAASDVASYVQTYVWTQSAASDLRDGDAILTYRVGTGYRLATGSMVAAYVSAENRAATLDMTSLTEVTPVDGNRVMVGQGATTGATKVEDFASYIAGKVADDILADVGAWQVVVAARYTALPNSATKILMSNTSDVAVGRSVRYTYGGTSYYGIVATLSANAYITIQGAALDTGVALTELAVCRFDAPEVIRLSVPGAYMVPWRLPSGETAQSLLEDVARRPLVWRGPAAKLVGVSASNAVADGTAQPRINVTIGGDAVLTDNSGDGLELSGTDATWVSASGVDVSKYSVAHGQSIEIECLANGAAGDAEDLSVDLIFVRE